MISKQTLINTELSPFKTCVYLTLITLFFSDGTQLLCARHSKKWRHSRTHSVREINSFPDPDQYGLFICCNASYSETEVRITSNVLSRIIAAFLLPNVLGIRTSRASSSVHELPKFLTRFAGLAITRNILSSKLWKTMTSYQMRITDARSMHSKRMHKLSVYKLIRSIVRARSDFSLSLIKFFKTASTLKF